MAKHLVLVGGGHAHMTVLANLRNFINKGHTVSVIAPSAYHYYSGMGPGMLGGTYTPDQIRFDTQALVRAKGAEFILDRVERIDPGPKRLHLASGGFLSYDVVSFNTGSFVPGDLVAEGSADVFFVKPIEKLMEARARILELAADRTITISIVGGGPSAVEMAGNVWRISREAARHPPRIRIVAGRGLLPRLPQTVRRTAQKSLERRGIVIHTAGSAQRIQTGSVTLASGERLDSDITFAALGIRPSPIFKASGLPVGPDGGLRVNRFLQTLEYPEIFGGGDCISFQEKPLDKVGVYAVRQNAVLDYNLMAALEGGALQPFDPGGTYLLILNLGDGTGILYKRWLRLNGRLAFKIKDFIDRRFMAKFQATA